MKKIIAYITMILALLSCSKEESKNDSPCDVDGHSSFVFGYHVKSLCIPETKSAFIAPAFNDEKITGMTVAVYDNATGRLHYKKHFTDGFERMEIPLHIGSVYNLYALANMGDQTGNLPDTRNALLSGFNYVVPSYSDVNSRGIPMTGRVEYYTAGRSADAAFEMRRLFAKVTLNVTMKYDGGTAEGVKVTRLRVGNGNAVLSAFGSSKLTSASGRLTEDDYVVNNSVDASSVVFYVPENLQGKIGSATIPHEKNPDMSSAVNSVKDLLTYVDVTVTANSVYYTGTVHYRSYLGSDAKTDFNIAGNNRYVWDMTLTEDGLVYDDWKTDQTDLTAINHTLSFDKEVYAVDPRKSVVCEVEYNDSYRGRLFGLGGIGTRDTRWLATPPAALPHSESGNSFLEYSYNASTDRITWSPTRYAPPGDYTITVETNDGRYYDEAVLHINDTRWINTDNAYGGRTRETTISRSSVNESTRWDIGYAFGDLSVSDSDSRESDSPNASVFAGNSIEDKWSQYIGYSLKGDAVNSLSQNGQATANAVSYSLSEDILMGDYVYEIYWKDTWNDALGDYSLKDSAILHITGIYINGLRINPTTQTLAIGQSGTLRAIVTNGQASYKKVSWEVVSGKECVSISPTDNVNAEVTALKSGTATIRAVAADGSGCTATATVNVNNPPASLTLVPASETMYMGTTLQYAAIVTYSDGSTRNVSSNCWYSGYNGNIISIDSNGLVTARNTAGSCSLTASYTELSQTVKATAEVTVVARPTPISMDYMGDTEMYILHNATYGSGGTDYDLGQIPVRLNYADGSQMTGTIATLGATLVSGDTDILASVGRGKVRTKGRGVTTLTLTCDGQSETINMYISNIFTSNVNVYVRVNSGLNLNCYLTPYDQTQDQACDVEWSSENPSVARVINGYGSRTSVFGVSEGTARINMKYEGQYGKTTFGVSAHVQGSDSGSTTYLEIIPGAVTLNEGETCQLTAKYHTVRNGVDDGGITVSPSWSVNNGSLYASVNSTGMVTALAEGTARIRASYSGRNAYSTVVVSEVQHTVSRYLEITPSQVTMTAGSSTQLTAKLHTVTDGSDDGGVAVDASWSVSSGSGIVSVSSSGLASALATGNAIILGTYNYSGETFPATAAVTVVTQIQEVYRIGIAPSETTIAEGATQSYEVRKYTDIYADGTMTYHDTTGTAVTNTDVEWSVSSGASYATINASGVATGVASGDAVVKAVLKSDRTLTATAVLHVDVVFNVDPGNGDTGSGSDNY